MKTSRQYIKLEIGDTLYKRSLETKRISKVKVESVHMEENTSRDVAVIDKVVGWELARIIDPDAGAIPFHGGERNRHYYFSLPNDQLDEDYLRQTVEDEISLIDFDKIELNKLIAIKAILEL